MVRENESSQIVSFPKETQTPFEKQSRQKLLDELKDPEAGKVRSMAYKDYVNYKLAALFDACTRPKYSYLTPVLQQIWDRSNRVDGYASEFAGMPERTADFSVS